MSNAMKKLKLLHHLTAASSQLPSPPLTASPTIQTTNYFPPPPPNARPSYSYNPPHYTDVLRNARSALQSLANHPAYHTQHPSPPVPPPQQYYPPQQPQYSPQPQTQCALPAGFLTLTPTNNDTYPGLSVPADMAINPRPPHSNSHLTSRPPSSRRKLTKENLSRLPKDTRPSRWDRVSAYVSSQRAAVLPFLPASSMIEKDDLAFDKPGHFRAIVGRKRRAEEFAAMDMKCKMLDDLDVEERRGRSLWSGGSGGTNGVDEFVWSEDEDEDVEPQMQIQTQQQNQHTSQQMCGGKRGEQGREVEMFEMDGGWRDMPRLCREGELEGGLARMVGRRVSAIY